MESNIVFDARDMVLKINDNIMDIFNLNFDLKTVINGHSELVIEYNIPEESLNEYFEMIDTENKISLEVNKEGISRIMFVGMDASIEMCKINGGDLIKIRAYSISEVLDRQERYKSYQNPSFNYSQIFDEICNLYDNELVNILGENIGNYTQGELIIQNEESDWAFINRICSYYEVPVLNIGTGIRVDFNSSAREVLIDESNCKINIIRERKKSYGEILLETYEYISLGEKVKVKLNGREEVYFVIDSEYGLSERLLYCKYKLVKEGEYKRNKYRNLKIVGKAIEGTVVEVLDVDGIAKMTVDFNKNLVKRGGMIEDENGNEVETSPETRADELFKFPYVTPYSQSHTGYFCTPEVGDNVIVYFPTEKEEDGFVLGSVNSIGNGRFTDRFNRNFIIPAEGSVNGEGIDEPQYNMTLGNNIFGVITGTTNKEVEFENINVLEDSTTVVTNNKSVRVDNDMMYQVANNKTVQVDNNLSFNVSNDYQAQSTNFKVQASANVDAQGSSGVNIKGAQVKVEADAEASIKGGAMVKVGAPSVSVGS